MVEGLLDKVEEAGGEGSGKDSPKSITTQGKITEEKLKQERMLTTVLTTML